MKKETHRDDAIEEIYSHVKQLKAEQDNHQDTGQENYEPSIIIKDKTKKILVETSLEDISKEDIFEIIKPEELVVENLSKMKIDMKSAVICDICGKDFIFEDNLSGLTIRGELFSCEKCCLDASKKILDAWVDYKQGKPGEIKPIALWLMQENNKTQLFD
ncbi:MAG: hypothetical protein FK731_04405 [Asgard group archaeon]|nr:hypothetical protein [Asgard group archaeon]